MKDLLGRKIKVMDYIAYALTVGRSANLAVYQVREVFDDKVKANKLTESYGWMNGEYPYLKGVKRKYVNHRWNYQQNTYEYSEMTPEEKAKVDSSTTTLKMPERALILDNFNPETL